MSRYENVAVEFRTFGNRRGFLRIDAENGVVGTDLIRLFPEAFEYDFMLDRVLFIEPGMPREFPQVPLIQQP